MKSLANGKSPGPDGFMKGYYLKLFTQLQTHMCTYFNSLAPKGQFPQGALLAHITVLTKEAKDHILSQNYHLISLLNTNLKIFTKILANQLKHFLPSIIYPNVTYKDPDSPEEL